jgi:DNA primase
MNVGMIYNLKCCTTGRWKDRLIFPVYQSGKLVAWTGRALGNPVNAPRYLSTSNLIKSAIFNEDELILGGDTLFITEGPVDALKVDYYGRDLGGRATCVFGTSITIDQISILKQVSKAFTSVVLLFDPEAVETAFDMSEWLPQATVGQVPAGVEDPGALTKDQVASLVRGLA